MRKSEGWIIGAGMTGLAASYESGATTLEAGVQPGGICRSYTAPSPVGGYRFEIGGGHWVFGGDPFLTRFLGGLGEWRSYQRRSAVYFPESGLLAPYPLQNHLSALGPALAAQCLAEMRQDKRGTPSTMADWIEHQFGPTLTHLFFGPFHELYTAGLWTRIAPQDSFKTPLNLDHAARGASGEAVSPAGYNQTFLYPAAGLDRFVDDLAARASVETGARVARIDAKHRQLEMADGALLGYEWLLATAPLDEVIRLAGIELDEEADPSTAVLVANLGGRRGAKCPDEHWIYVPRSRSGFHRVGFYSNVDASFLPVGAPDRASVYVERSYRRGARPPEREIEQYVAAVGEELREWGFLDTVEASAANWVETAYTWSLPGSRWRQTAITKLSELGIFMAGRYGNWRFQGIADSLREGLLAGAMLRGAGTGR
jgi:protoporphyrinogen oxidase